MRGGLHDLDRDARPGPEIGRLDVDEAVLGVAALELRRAPLGPRSTSRPT
ncbi:MAG TPA: hypothetical protein VNE71_05080 [Myxococcota bacterium]|nr:hypothetical protein [Myxococcota bacterium]